MKKLILIITIFSVQICLTQISGKIVTSDIDNFWTAFDSIQTSQDYTEKLKHINNLYINAGSNGLKAFMKLREYSDTLYVNLIDKYPKFWNSIRPNTLSIRNRTAEMRKAVERLQGLYPNLKEADIYFTIGGLKSGGTVKGNKVLVGAEIATGNPETVTSEFENDWLKNVFKKQSLDNVVSLNIHEYVHTQQKSINNNILLHHVIREGVCDFIAELALEKPLQTRYIEYGKKHFTELKKKFKEEMFSENLQNWLYNGGQTIDVPDLGYFIGYAICKSYYKTVENHRKAIKTIIELDYDDEEAMTLFLKKSNFFENGFNKRELIENYEGKKPIIERIEPFQNGTSDVKVTIEELRIFFSEEMNARYYSLNYTKNGKRFWPIKKLIGFQNNNKTLVLQLDLEANREYEFIINCEGFQSKNGYPLKGGQYIFKFKTK